jgi:succinate dehydrogenase / fumarate reductase membrane anchor subunit
MARITLNIYPCYLVTDINIFLWVSFYMKGSLIWNTQRYSSIFILCYIIYIVSFFISENNINFFTWSNFFLSFETRFITSITFILILVHSFIGLWTVGTDYLTKRTLGFLNKPLARYANVLRTMYSFLFSLLGAIYLLAILYIIWL